MPGVTMGAGTPQAGTIHNVVFIATEHDSVYALDADSSLGANAQPLWRITLLDAAHGAAAGATTVPYADVIIDDIVPEIGITSTPVIDPASNTIYVLGKSKESGTYVQRLHALDITTGAEKFGGPVALSASVLGTGTGSSGGILNWDPLWENQRAGLLLQNGIVYLAFGSHGDLGPWHGWILAYNAATLRQTGAWCASRNATTSGIWLSGAGLTANVPDPVNHPYGLMFTATGNGIFDAAPPYNNSMDYGDSIIKLDLTNGAPTMILNGSTVGDDFTPRDQAYLNNQDLDQASGGVLLLPDAVSGGRHLLTQVGKTGRVYVLDQNNLGGYNPNNTTDPQQQATVGTMFSMPAYWNGNLYFWAGGDNLKAYSMVSGSLSPSPISTSAEWSNHPGATPTVSASGTTNGIVWDIRSDGYSMQGGREILYAHDATNVANLLYSSEQNVARDNPGNPVKFGVPTVASGKVYVGAQYQVSVFGLLNGQAQAATPVISPASTLFNPSVQVTITDSTPGVQIYYTTDGTTPTTASSVYTGAITVTSTETIQAFAAGPGFLESLTATATYTLQTQVLAPTFSPVPGDYASAQLVTIATVPAWATIYYTTNGSVPSTSSTKYTGPVPLTVSATLSAFATAPNLNNSPVASGSYFIDNNAVSSVNFGQGFTAGGMVLNYSAKLSGTRLRLTDGGTGEGNTAWYPTPANVQTFTTDFSFQITPGTNPTSDGFTFAVQGNNTSARGSWGGGGLAYGPDTPGGTPGIPKSVAVKFDLFSNAGEGVNSTGIYTNGASPTTPFVDLTNTAINLHSGHIFNVHMTYDGTNLVMTMTDATTNGTFTQSWPVNIPATVGGNTAYLGFTAGTGGSTAIQEILTWSYATN